MKPFEANGHWHLPDTPSEGVAGVLYYTPQDGLSLRLSGLLGGQEPLQPEKEIYELIHGVAEVEGKTRCFTLLDNFRTNSTFRWTGFSTETVHATRAISGPRCLGNPQLRFESVRVSFTHLMDWLGKSGIEKNVERIGERTVLEFTYRFPELPDSKFLGKPLTLSFSCNTNERRGEVAITETSSIGISELDDLDDGQVMSEFVRPLQDLLSFATDEANEIESIRLGQYDGNSTKSNEWFELFFQPIYVRPDSPKKRLPNKMVFTYDDISNYAELIDRWATFSVKYSTFRNLYFGIEYSPPGYIDQKFLCTVDAVVHYFADQGATAVPDVVRDVLTRPHKTSGLTSEKNEVWVLKSLPTEEWLTFPSRLLAEIEKSKDLLEPIIPCGSTEFVDSIVRTRRYLTFRDSHDENGSLSGQEMHWAIRRLRIILQVCILDDLGIDKEQIKKCISRNEYYVHLKNSTD